MKLNSGVSYQGILACLDGYMNIAMEQTEEYVDGQLTNKYGDCFIRGTSLFFFLPQRHLFTQETTSTTSRPKLGEQPRHQALL